MNTYTIRLFNPSLATGIPSLSTPKRGACYLPFIDTKEVQYILEVIPNGETLLPTHSYMVLNELINTILKEHGADVILDRTLVYDDIYRISPQPYSRAVRIVTADEKGIVLFDSQFYPTVDGNTKSVSMWTRGVNQYIQTVTETE